MSWSNSTTNNIANKRAGGRRKYNAQRQQDALRRRVALIETFDYRTLTTVHGTKAEAAKLFNVSLATISRDVKYFRQGFQQLNAQCIISEGINQLITALMA